MHAWTRRAALAAVIGLGVGLAACGGGKPESTTSKFYKLVNDNKVDDAIALFSVKDVHAEQMTTARGKFMTMVGQMHGTMKSNGGLDDVLTDEVVKKTDDEVTVRSTLKYKNGKTQKDNMNLSREDGRWLIKVK